MSTANPPEPLTASARDDSRRVLVEQETSLQQLDERITAAEEHFADVVADLRRDIERLQRERSNLQQDIAHTKSRLSPIWRLPKELLREIFVTHFDENPCAAWVLSSVCGVWRQVALGTPRIWSKIRLVTDETTSPDVLRLWLERSGMTIPLDVEIYVRATRNAQAPSRSRSGSPVPAWMAPPHAQPVGTITYVHAGPGGHGPIQVFPMPGAIQPGPPGSPPLTPRASRNGSDEHWGHIAFFYLVQEIKRWERFIFRFDKHFASIGALRSINKNAPMLQEFEVSCAEPGYFADWNWIASTDVNATIRFPQLKSLNLQYVPFNWSSPLLRQNLTMLSIRALPTHLALDRILGIIAANPRLEKLALHFSHILPAVLPLTLTTLPNLRDLSLGGHYLFSTLAEHLITPSLTRLALDIEARDPIEDLIQNLLARSNNPPLTHFSLAYNQGTPYFFTAGSIVSWNFLGDLPFLKSLKVGGAGFEAILMALTVPDEDNHNQWLCPNLTTLGMKGCHSHNDGPAKLVQLVDARNPEGGVGAAHGGVSPARMKKLELLECVPLGQDIVAWLQKRVEKVVWSEPPYDSL
ncbi:hypothetical protein OE88DRAFT_1713648 [Heliocybe sulcata]|uniref:F-box domain-containing protein n=1 Tax=Heliocybe sulcata TaxID=5364 RepID=A0A5C3MVY5_9AGAM|nr:hypothetical protein OE88DRAFT_1713648 [Heliocybe sulcata]